MKLRIHIQKSKMKYLRGLQRKQTTGRPVFQLMAGQQLS
jgi:hypothetical protein